MSLHCAPGTVGNTYFVSYATGTTADNNKDNGILMDVHSTTALKVRVNQYEVTFDGFSFSIDVEVRFITLF